MTPADIYRRMAAELGARARRVSPPLRSECERLAHAYIRLAELADRNSHSDSVYEPPLTREDRGTAA